LAAESAEKTNLRRIKKALEGRRSLLIASHDNPDPDGIVSALLLARLLKSRFGVSCTLSFSGVIGRAENNALVEYAGVDFKRLDKLDPNEFDGVALVDTQPGTGNNRFEEDANVVLVFDHHRRRSETRRVAFSDIRTRIGATTTLLYLYWKAADIRVSTRYATLMLYALGSETADMGRDASGLDREVYKELYARSDLRALSSIANAKVERPYFSVVHTAIERSRTYGPVVITRLDRVPYPDAVAQIAEYFLRLKEARYTFTLGSYGKALLMSMRSDVPDVHLGRIARKIVKDVGTAGGHGSAAGGQIDVSKMSSSQLESTQRRLVTRLLTELGVEERRGRRLI
jgi:nanoRNase/pAp phosphatase (c-di-AMP/oligoRNAs hydrolase)